LYPEIFPIDAGSMPALIFMFAQYAEFDLFPHLVEGLPFVILKPS
jgi:hypothetical protein